MWVPALAGRKSGEVGHANYQHPQRLRDGTYSLEVDRFPLLLVATAMRALKADKGLWAKYDNGDNMLFKETDLAAPGRSELFEELSSLPDPGLVMLAAQVRAALKGSLESAALLEEAMPETKGAPAPSAKRPSKLASGPPSGMMRSKPVPTASPVVSAPAADALAFDADASPSLSFVRKKKRAVEKPAGVFGRLPLTAWIGGGAALGLVVAVVGGFAVWALTGKSNPPAPIPTNNRVVQKDAGAPIPPVVRADPDRNKDGAATVPATSKVPDPVVVPVAPPLTPTVPDGRADQPGVHKILTFDWNLNKPIRSLRLSPDGRFAVAIDANGYVSTASTQNGHGIDGFLPRGYQAREATLSPDGRQAVVAGDDKVVHVEAFTGYKALARMTGHLGPVNGVDVSADGKRALSCGDDGNIFLWDLEANKEISHWKGSDKPISVVRFSPDGRAALSHGADGIIHFWDVTNRHETGSVAAFRPGDPGRPLTAAFLPADRAVVGFTNTFGYWDLKSGQCTSSFGGGPVCAVAASADGRLAAFAVQGAPQFIVIDEKRLGVFWSCRGVPPVAPEGLSFAPDGRHILVGCADATVHYWAVNPGDDGAAPSPAGSGPPAAALSFETGWDKPVDPDGDCKFTPDKTVLTIEAPGKQHDLSFRMNAPRMLRKVEGDFTVQVRVDGDFRLTPETSPATVPIPSVKAGLVVMAEGGPRAELVCSSQDNPNVPGQTVLWSVWPTPRSSTGASAAISDAPTYLRLRRGGNRFFASYSQDGVKWADMRQVDQEVEMPARVNVGVIATTTKSVPFKARFDDFRLTGGGSPTPPPAVAVEKRPPPPAADVARELEEIKATFKDAYDAIHSPKDAYALSGKLLAEAHRSKDQPARQYALFLEARDLAARGEDLPTSLEIIDETATIFAVNVREAKTAALLAAGKTFSNRAAAKAYLDAAVPLLEQARADDAYDLVAPLLPAVRQAYTDAQQPDLTKIASALVTQIEHLQNEYKAVQPSLATLKEKPDDADANLAAGKFYALRKQDWDKGAPLLAKGSDAGLSEAALKEAGPPSTAADRTAAGDAWWKAGEKDATFKTALLRRALFWYDKALPDLTDKEEERVRNRVIDLTKQFPDFATAWANLDVSRAEVVGNCYLLLKPGQILSTKQPSKGVLRATVVARAAKSRLNFELLQSYKDPKVKEVKDDFLVGWEIKDMSLSVHWLYRQAVRPSMQTFTTSAKVDAEAWVKYSCDLREADTNLGVNDRILSNIAIKNDPTRARTFLVTAVGQVLEIKSLTVEPISKP